MRIRKASAAITVAASLACASRPDPCAVPVSTAPPIDLSCMTKEAPRQYLTEVHRKMIDAWILPSGVRAHQCVVARFFLLPDGELREQPEILTGDDQRLRESVYTAILNSAPFEPMSEEAQCLAGLPIIGKFRNPVH